MHVIIGEKTNKIKRIKEISEISYFLKWERNPGAEDRNDSNTIAGFETFRVWFLGLKYAICTTKCRFKRTILTKNAVFEQYLKTILDSSGNMMYIEPTKTIKESANCEVTPHDLNERHLAAVRRLGCNRQQSSE